MSINEPECHIKNYHLTCFFLMELVKRFIFEHF